MPIFLTNHINFKYNRYHKLLGVIALHNRDIGGPTLVKPEEFRFGGELGLAAGEHQTFPTL